MLEAKHESFFPPTANCTLWRYMDFTKLLSLLENRNLYFPRADQFDDPYEGHYSRVNAANLLLSKTGRGYPPNAIELFLSGADQARQQMYISCWFASECESAAMWKLYLQGSEGVAIRTDHESLVAALVRAPLMVRTTMVNYVDYDKVAIPIGNLFFPFVHKRSSFAHETELRAIIWSGEDANKPQIPEGATGVAIDLEPEQLIKAIHVSPTAPRWFGQLVEQILRRYGLSIPVVRSSLYDRPSY